MPRLTLTCAAASGSSFSLASARWQKRTVSSGEALGLPQTSTMFSRLPASAQAPSTSRPPPIASFRMGWLLVLPFAACDSHNAVGARNEAVPGRISGGGGLGAVSRAAEAWIIWPGLRRNWYHLRPKPDDCTGVSHAVERRHKSGALSECSGCLGVMPD